jgi:RNA polymerase sigma-70 factor (ECF subfamily)
LDELRVTAREIPTPELPDEASAEPEVGESCACSLAQLSALPAAYEDVLRRVDVDGSTLDEVASALNISKGNAAVRLHRARRALRDQLLKHCGVASARQCLSCACVDRGCCMA